jgi:hypothetical protein
MHQSSTEPIILSYKRRRYDGGPEMELIAYLEAQQQQSTGGLGLIEELMEQQHEETPKTLWQQVCEVLFIGPLEIFVGILGMATTGIAATAFKAFMNPALNAQSRSVFADCWDTFKQGCVHTVKAPIRVTQVLKNHTRTSR